MTIIPPVGKERDRLVAEAMRERAAKYWDDYHAASGEKPTCSCGSLIPLTDLVADAIRALPLGEGE